MYLRMKKMKIKNRVKYTKKYTITWPDYDNVEIYIVLYVDFNTYHNLRVLAKQTNSTY